MKVRSKLFYTYVTFVLLYISSFLFQRPISNLHQLEPSIIQYRFLSLTILVPAIIIWFAAFYGYYKLRVYASMIKDTPDGKHVEYIAKGLFILAVSLPIVALTTATANTLVEHNQSLATTVTIVQNYISVLFPLVAFIFINIGAHGLSILSKQRPSYKVMNLLAAAFIGIAIVFCYLVMTTGSLDDIYHLPPLLVILTLVFPYMFTWYLGLVAAYQTHLYSRNAPGTLYRQTWNMLATGIAAIIIAQIARQYIGNTTLRLENLQFARLLFMVYILSGILSVGYILVALGAKRLQKIEEV